MLIDVKSLRCAEVLPVRLIETSHELGWTSALVEHHQVMDAEDVFETAPTPDQTVVVMTRGEQRLQSYRGGVWRSATYLPGTVGLTPGGTVHRLRRRINRDAGPACKINIYIPQIFFSEAADQIGAAPGGTRLTSLGHLDNAVRHLALSLLRAMRAGAPDIYAESAVRWLALHLLTLSRGSSEPDNASRLKAMGDRRLRRALDCIEQRYADPLSVADLAAVAGISPFHFSRLFRQATGVSPYQRLLDARLRAAEEMLAVSDTPVAEVARRCGFARASHFASHFSRRFGVSPRDFGRGSHQTD